MNLRQAAVFVDADHFWAQTNTLLTGAPGPRRNLQVHFESLRQALVQETSRLTADAELLRVYWYDTVDAAGQSGEHAALERLDDFKLRLSPRRGGDHGRACSAQLAADLLVLAQHRAIQHAVLVAADADWIAPMLTVQSMGLRVHLLSVGEATVPALVAEADRKRQWHLEDVRAFATRNPHIHDAADAEDDTPPPAALWAGIAEQAYDHIQSSPHALALAKLLPDARSLPREVDVALLVAGRQSLGRSLSESEKRDLRRVFRQRFQSPAQPDAVPA